VSSRDGRTRRILGTVAVLALVGTATAGYEVKPGDSLTSIANRHGTTVERLANLNDLRNPNHIVIGQTLKVPGRSGGGGGGGASTHTIRPGQSLSGIAKRYGVSAQRLAEVNGIRNPNLIFAGQTLKVPSKGGGAAQRTPTRRTTTYTIKPGDTLSRIATAHGVTLQALARANGITNTNHIVSGRTLKITTGGSGTKAAAARPTRKAPSKPAGTISRARAEKLIEKVAVEYNWKPSWPKAIAWQESGWQMGVRSSVGAIGIMQVMPGTGEFVSRYLVGRPLDLTDPRDNVTAGIAFLDYLYDLTGGDIRKSLAGYYQGLASVSDNGMYTDTKQYIRNVVALEARFR
jgi:N-acetylmuramoyl-L-alanine amidase